ncbi:hypothetical protein H0H87_001689 [Tephrocybe sp. NHM501043]|nr:hypothetical protein H0H87_001689 [Tephrocybe sp. NHM501043]
MALPDGLRISITPPELELIASHQLIEIVPLISMEKTAFISGAYGPLRPPNKATVPIWMAVNLKAKKKCHIIAPAWLNVDDLENPDKLRSLLKDLREARQAKSRDGLQSLDHSELSVSRPPD